MSRDPRDEMGPIPSALRRPVDYAQPRHRQTTETEEQRLALLAQALEEKPMVLTDTVSRLSTREQIAALLVDLPVHDALQMADEIIQAKAIGTATQNEGPPPDTPIGLMLLLNRWARGIGQTEELAQVRRQNQR